MRIRIDKSSALGNIFRIVYWVLSLFIISELQDQIADPDYKWFATALFMCVALPLYLYLTRLFHNKEGSH